MQQITRKELEYLIENNLLQMERGKYPDLAIVNKSKKGKRKKHYVPDYLANRARHIHKNK